ncbi:hypothetical protein [Streptomyces sp. W1SF4]|uniref:hypothetical protein n=1 Tax=Streptomyces sp. W1SF4 TaxID=2305220 RepID=UPI0013DF596C|nr:hypothetical protein [Streptomyces sp. W1SF4]
MFRALRAAYAESTTRPETALRLTDRLAAAAAVVGSLEALVSARADHRDGTVLRGDLMSRRIPADAKLLSALVKASSGRRTEQVLETIRLAASVTLLVARPGRTTRSAALALLAVSSAVTHRRHTVQSDGSEQLLFQVQAASALASLAGGGPRVTDACLWYIAAQSTLAYTVAGYSKLAGAEWRSGEALPGVLRTETYGDRKAFELVRTHPRTACTAGTAVVLGECGFGLLYFLGRGRYAPVFVSAGTVFHLVNARAMGLGRFLFAFVATYPAILYTARRVSARSGDVR